MRLWHQDLIVYLPRNQLLGQHRECSALRGLSWGRKHSTVQYVFNYNPGKLYQYHLLVIEEMKKRGYRVDYKWLNLVYRGKRCESWQDGDIHRSNDKRIYPEHNDKYLKECIENLKNKGVNIIF